MGKNLLRTLYLFTVGFCALFIMTAYWQLVRGPELALHPRNPRLLARQQTVPRGGIYDRHGESLAESIQVGEVYRRQYHGGPSLGPTIGYSHPRLGLSGLEQVYNEELAGLTPEDSVVQWWQKTRGKGPAGNSIFTTLDLGLQKLAAQAFGERRGAVVALVPSTGEILALVSSPGYDPNGLEELWPQLREDPHSPLLNRAIQGRYPPGSAFKVFTLAAALASETVDWHGIYPDEGSLEIGNYTLTNPGELAYGPLTLVDALARSSNVVFGRIGLEMGQQLWSKQVESWGFKGDLEFDLPLAAGHVPDPEEIGRADLAQLAIGQGALTVTPLHMAVLAATIANDGVMMRPYLVETIVDPLGRNKYQVQRKAIGRPITALQAQRVGEAMAAVVERGTGQRARVAGVGVAGKTGTAQNPHGPDHSWFIAYAPRKAPQIAIAVIVEGGGAGGGLAATITREILQGFFGLSGT
ncbi:MAG: peptidoglycan D,D-transpeptidase FtsI family protein [Limnochordia bacterium]|jgi:peptidoglycan glycosyltransferase